MAGTESSILKVVTIEDTPLVVERLQLMLAEIEGVRYMGNARNIAGALRLISQQAPHVAILDIHLEDDMPDANGLNLLITIKKKYPKLKAIMLTNLSEPQYRNTCVAFGADYFFDKSIDFDKIPEALNDLMNQLAESIKKVGNDKY